MASVGCLYLSFLWPVTSLFSFIKLVVVVTFREMAFIFNLVISRLVSSHWVPRRMDIFLLLHSCNSMTVFSVVVVVFWVETEAKLLRGWWRSPAAQSSQRRWGAHRGLRLPMDRVVFPLHQLLWENIGLTNETKKTLFFLQYLTVVLWSLEYLEYKREIRT